MERELLRKVQMVQLEIAKEIRRVCEENDIRYFLADGSGYVDCNGSADILLYRNGTQSTLSSEEQVELMNKGDISYVASKCGSHSAMRLSDQKLVTVRSDGQTLDIWLDGQDMHSVSIPENVIWAYQNPAFFSRFVRVGHNGYVLMSCFSQTSGENMTGFAAYDSVAGTWTIIEDAARGLYNRVIAMGKEKTVPAYNRKGELVPEKQMGFGLVSDERFCDGLYYALSLRMLRKFMMNPKVLEKPLEAKVEDED